MGEKISQTKESSQKTSKGLKKLASKIIGRNYETSTDGLLFRRSETKHENIYPQLPEQKSLLIAYILWYFLQITFYYSKL